MRMTCPCPCACACPKKPPNHRDGYGALFHCVDDNGLRVRWIGHGHARGHGHGVSLVVRGDGGARWCGGDGFSQHKEKDSGARLPPPEFLPPPPLTERHQISRGQILSPVSCRKELYAKNPHEVKSVFCFFCGGNLDFLWVRRDCLRMLSATKVLVPAFSCVWACFSFSLAAAQSFDDLRFRSIGPAVMGGRVDAIAVVESEPSTIYVGTASGGLWKTVNNGTTWTSIFDEYATSSIGDVVVSASDPQIVWVGTGEANNRQSSSFGDGVYKSIDAGKTWAHQGLVDSGHIGKVVLDPSNPERVFVAAFGSLWSAGGERGVFRTLDGGRSWEQVLEIDEDTGVSTLALDPINANVLYAAAYQRRRTPWGFDGGGPGSGLYKTVDGGNRWVRLDSGLPEGPLGRIGVAVFRGDPNIVFALVEHKTEGGLYRSSDRGESWTKINDLNPRPMYYSKIFVDPTDVYRIYVLGSSFHVSDDGGHSFVTNRDMTPRYDVGVHGDHHVLWVDPENSNHLVLGGDGGLYFSWDRSRSFAKINNLPIAQFYDIAVDMDEPYNVYAGAQDTHSWVGPSATRNQIGILNGDWIQTNFGDGMYQQADPSDSSIVYTESQGGNIVRLDRRTGNRKAIKPYPKPDEDRYRFHWTSPILISTHDPKTVFFGGNRFFVSSNRGDSWTASSDLTRNEDRDELTIMGLISGEDTLSRHDGVSEWGTITTISESALAAGTVYVGTDDGRIQLTRDGGSSWKSLEGSLPGMDPVRSKVSRIVASSVELARAYASFDRHALGDFTPYLFVTESFGDSWKRLALPDAIGLGQRGERASEER